MANVERVFVDTNVLTRATIDSIPLHIEARVMLDKLWDEGAELFISHQVIREYIANATRPQTYSPPLPIGAVLKQVEDFRKSFRVLSDSPLVLSTLLDLVRDVPVGGKQVYDANVVATMLPNSIEALLTNNVKDFKRYEAYIRIIPLVEDTEV